MGTKHRLVRVFRSESVSAGAHIKGVIMKLEIFGDRIRRFRRKHEYSCEELGRMMGVSRQVINRWERGAEMSNQSVAQFETLEILISLLPAYGELQAILQSIKSKY